LFFTLRGHERLENDCITKVLLSINKFIKLFDIYQIAYYYFKKFVFFNKILHFIEAQYFKLL